MGLMYESTPTPPDRPADSASVATQRIHRLLEQVSAAAVSDGPAPARDVAALAVLDLLLEWRAAGGEVRLEPPSAATVARLLDARAAASRPAPTVDPNALLATILDGIVFSPDDEVEVLRLHAAIRDSERWRLLPRELQRGVVALCAARLRRLQDDQRLIHPRLEESFSMLTAFSKREQPGYVVGLSRHHRPVRTSWLEDAEAWWERLRGIGAPETPAPASPNVERLLTSLANAVGELEAAEGEAKEAAEADVRRRARDALSGGVASRDPRMIRICTPVATLLDGAEFRVLRKMIREEADEAAAEDPDDREDVPADWAWWGRTRARRAVIVGGDPREPNRQRIQRVFQFSELEWVPAEFRRNPLQSVRERVRAGKIDLVIILGAFVGHDADEVILTACKDRGVDCVHVDKGYGVSRIRASIERYIVLPKE